jgi:hypothetical protein
LLDLEESVKNLLDPSNKNQLVFILNIIFNSDELTDENKISIMKFLFENNSNDRRIDKK